MAEKFSDLAARARRSWSEDAHKVYGAASTVFQHEVSAQLELGEQLATARRNHGMTQSFLAKATGVPQAEISRIENGNANPTIETLNRLAIALGKQLALK